MTKTARVLFFFLMAAVSRVSPAQAPTAAWSKAFDEADRESRHMLAALECVAGIGGAVRRGLFGPTAATANNAVCVETRDGNLAVLLTVDSLFKAPSEFVAVNLAAQSPVRSAVDTAAILAVARAEAIAGQRGGADYEKRRLQVAEISYRVANDSLQVWLLPATAVQGPPFSVGGERGYLFSPDGKTVFREIDRLSDYRLLTLADTGTLTIRSSGDSLPLLSEMLLANLLNKLGRSVTIELPPLTATLVGRGASAVWVHQARKP